VDLMPRPLLTRTVFFGLFALTAGIQPARSQEPPCISRKLPVSFRDAQNLPLQNISVADLEAKIKSKPVKFLSLAPDPRPHRIVLALDQSGSMGSTESGPALWNLELSLARHFFEVNRQKSRIAMLFFNDQVNDVIDFSQGNSAIGEKLRQAAKDQEYAKTHVKGRTALRDAIFRAIQLLDHPSSADAVYVLTDGGDNASHQSAAEITRRLAVASVRVFAVLLYQSPGHRNRTPEELSGPTELTEIAQKSGGEILSAAEPRGNRVALTADPEGKLRTEETLARLYQTILQDSLLEVELPFPIAKNERWELKLSSDARRRWKNAQITYPDTLTSCNAEVFGSGRH
jgi:Mg-chelatase subunit ChlD